MPNVTFYLFTLLLFTGFYASGQQQVREVRGVVQDSTGIPLVGVTVRLYAPSDTMMASTNDQGRFVFSRVAASRFKLSFSLIGFQLSERSYESDNLLPITELVTVNLKEQPEELQEIAIYGVLPVQIKEDTVQYNAAAFSVRSGALLEELIRLFPGIEVNRSGEVYLQGQPVSRVRVNGKNFFNGDLLTATRNLPADIVENVQVIDDYGDEANITGIKSGEPEKVLNINIKENRNHGFFGQVTGGAGGDASAHPDFRYIGSFAANQFDGNRQISVLGSANNTNTSLFSFGDISGAGSRNGPDLNNMIDASDGINTARSIGFNFRDEIAEGVTTYGGYTLTDRNNWTQGRTDLRSIYIFQSILSQEEVSSRTGNLKHKLAWTVEANLDSVNFLKISPGAAYNTLDLASNSSSLINSNYLQTRRQFDTEGNSSNPNFDLDVFYNHRFRKKGRNLSIALTGAYIRQSRRDQVRDFSESGASSSVLFLQNLDNFSLNHNIGLKTSFVEPISDNSLLELSYDYRYNAIRNERAAFNIDTTTFEPLLIDSLSVNYSYLFQTSTLGVNFQSKVDRLKYTLGFAAQPTQQDGRIVSEDQVISLRRVNFIPTAMLQYRISSNQNLSLNYRGQNNQPAFSQIQPVRDISNPQYVVSGNANLKPEFMNTVSLQYRHFSVQSGNSFFSNLTYIQIRDKVVNNRFSVPNSTRQETEFMNANGFFDVRAYYNFSAPLAGDILTLNLSGDVDYTNDITYINQIRNTAKRSILSQNAQLSFRIEDLFEADLRGAFLSNRVNYSLPNFLGLSANSISLGLGGRSYFSKNWSVSFDLAQQFNDGFSSVVNVNPTLLNVFIERTFLKNDIGSIRLQGFDLFNQNTGVSRQVLGNDIFDVRNNRLARYFMLSLNIRLRKFPD